MLIQSLIEIYLESSVLSGNERSKRNLATVLTKFFGQTKVTEFCNYSRQDLIAMLTASSIMSMNTFESHKSKIGSFIKWLCSTGDCSEKLLDDWKSIHFSDIDRSDFFRTYYFKDFSELYASVQDSLGGIPSEQDTFKAAATLVWFGIEVKDLPDILKEDFHEDAGYITHPITKRKLYLPELAVKLLSDYKHSDAFPSTKFGGSMLTYPDTQYLFRTYKNAHLSAAQITNLSAAANRAAENSRKVFQWNRIYLSGLFKRMLDYENQFGEIGKTNYETLKQFFERQGQNPRKGELSQKYKEYQEFTTYMYSSSR